MKNVILVDGNNLLFRSFYATMYTGNLMKTSNGVFTNAVYGFVNMLNKIITEETPHYMLVAFDKGKTFRHDLYADYKAGRLEMPVELRGQFAIAKDVLTAMGISYLEADNYEADDIIGSVAKIVDKDPDFIATIVSSDKDLLQLISNDVEVKLLKQKDYIRYNKEQFIADFGFEPIHMIDLKALQGDASDNIKGVKGIGEKTALKLIGQYHTIENLYSDIDNIKGSLKDKLIAGKSAAAESKDLCTIYSDMDLELDMEAMKYHGPNIDALNKLYHNLEFNSLIQKNMKQTSDLECIRITSIDEIDFENEYALYLEYDNKNYHTATVVGVGLASNTQNLVFDYQLLVDNITKFKGKIISYNVKAMYVINEAFKELEVIDDIMLMAYINNYTVKDDVSSLANSFGFNATAYDKKMDEDEMFQNIGLKAKICFELKAKMAEGLNKDALNNLYQKIELPLAKTLANMEIAGVCVESNVLKEIGNELASRLETLEQDIYGLVGHEFNISSPKQLGPVLFEELGLKGGKKTKTGYSTDKDVLAKLQKTHPVIDKIIEYRTLSKVNGTYAVGLNNYVMEDGKIHPIFNQVIARTGRLSCTEPNLQNIPIRNEEGRIIRKAFVPSPGHVLMGCDYSQIELRIFAHLSDVDSLKKAFNEGRDIHTQTAMDIYHVTYDAVTKEMRRVAKAVNFGIIYGISGFGLSNNLDIDVKEAQMFINKYLETFPGVKKYMDQVIADAKRVGYVKTLYGRIRNIEELHSNNFMVRSMGERMALNTPIQGTSADIIKVAMIRIEEAFIKAKIKSKMIIQVHDELIFDVLETEKDIVAKLVKSIMEDVIKLSIPLEVSTDFGANWYDVK